MTSFSFLSSEWPELAAIAIDAERHIFDDPDASLYKLRLLSEHMIEYVLNKHSITVKKSASLVERLSILETQLLVPINVLMLLQKIRIAGNAAVHQGGSSSDDAIDILKDSYNLCRWFFEKYAQVPTLIPPFETPKLQTISDVSNDIQNLMREISSLSTDISKEETERLQRQLSSRIKSRITSFANQSNNSNIFNNSIPTNVKNEFETGIALYKKQEYELAIPHLIVAANANHAEALHTIGMCYDFGRGLPQNETLAAMYYLKSAELGYGPAQGDLSYDLYMGIGLDIDYSSALHWAQRGVKQDDPVSLTILGGLYEKGNGVEQNYSKSYYYYRRAAELGNPSAANNTGIALLMGYGVEKNATEAAIWNTIAAKANIPGAQFNLALQYAYGDGVETDYQESHHWMELAATNGDSRAIEILKNEHNSEFTDRLKYDGLYCSENGEVLRFYDDGIVISISVSSSGSSPHYPMGDYFTRRNWRDGITNFDLQGNRIVFFLETTTCTYIYSCVVSNNKIEAHVRNITNEMQYDTIYRFYAFSELPGYIA